MFGFNRKELAYIRTLKVGAGTDAYAWQPGNGAAGVPSTLAGYSYIDLPDMADRDTGAKPVIFADFRKLYTIVDAFNAIMLRNPYSTDGFVTFSLQSFLGGDVVMPEAGCILVCAE
jgi:HK97 family phage major capsid protein